MPASSDRRRRGGNKGPSPRGRHNDRRQSSDGRNRHRQGPADRSQASAGLGRLLESPYEPTALEPHEGVILVTKGGWGELRRARFDYASRPDNALVPAPLIEKFQIQTGSLVSGNVAPPKAQDVPARHVLRDIGAIDGLPPESPERAAGLPFKDLTSVDPNIKLQLSGDNHDPSLELFDILTPLGKGQRGLIVAPPRTGKTMLLQGLARAISENHPEVHLMVLLVDERPEEATDWKRTCHGDVLSSTSDEMAATHVAIAELVIERAKRLVELGRDVVVLLDSLTRLGRAYNLETRNSGRTLSGGVDARTLQKPKSIFGAARNTEDGGSLTIIATALIETGSRMDEVIFEEFKGTGNMELVLSRKLADLRIFPAIDVHLSGTRKEEKLLPPERLKSVWNLRRVLQGVAPADGMRLLVQKIQKSGSDEEFFSSFLKKS